MTPSLAADAAVVLVGGLLAAAGTVAVLAGPTLRRLHRAPDDPEDPDEPDDRVATEPVTNQPVATEPHEPGEPEGTTSGAPTTPTTRSTP